MKDLSIMVDNVKFNYRVGLWIQKGNQVLIEKNPKEEFVVIPGGRVKVLENTKETLQREIEEEMHYSLDTEEIKVKAFIENFFHYDNKTYHEIYVLYKLNLDEGDTAFEDHSMNYDSEGSYYEWVDYDQLGEKNLLPIPLRNISLDDEFVSIIESNL